MHGKPYDFKRKLNTTIKYYNKHILVEYRLICLYKSFWAGVFCKMNDDLKMQSNCVSQSVLVVIEIDCQ